MASRIRLGIIGLGRAAGVMLPSFAAHPDIEIVAAADPLVAARERFASVFGGAVFADARAMIEGAALDAVYIASPHQFHVEHALLAAGAGKHFIIEKPLALTLDECDQIVAAARAAGVITLVGHTQGFNPALRRMRAIIESGELGRLRMMNNLVYGDFLYRPRRPEELDTRQGGGILYNQVPHQLEMIRVLAREPIRAVRATTGIWDAQRPTEGAMTAFVEFDSGVSASLTYSGYDHFDSDALCGWIGTGGRLRQAAHGAARRRLAAAGSGSETAARTARGFTGGGAVQQAPPCQPHFGFLLVSCERGDMRVSAQGVEIFDDAGVREIVLPPCRVAPDRDLVVDEFVLGVRTGQAPLQDVAWGRETMRAVLALLHSGQQRREIMLK